MPNFDFHLEKTAPTQYTNDYTGSNVSTCGLLNDLGFTAEPIPAETYIVTRDDLGSIVGFTLTAGQNTANGFHTIADDDGLVQHATEYHLKAYVYDYDLNHRGT